MKEHPILFSTPMVQAELENRKTMTRRTRGLEKINENPDKYEYHGLLPDNPLIHVFARLWKGNHVETIHIKSPYGQPEDLLWVRESFANINHPDLKYRFKADHLNPKSVVWSPSIHMPKSAARIWLQVKEIRVERLHDISTADIKSEGVRIPITKEGHIIFTLGSDNSAVEFLPDGYYADGADHDTMEQHEHTLFFAFWAELWCKVNGRNSWDLNPWVWVVKFKVLSTTGKPQLYSSKGNLLVEPFIPGTDVPNESIQNQHSCQY